ncbi:hypothetical protein SAMN02787142_0623 [Burkholderia sp. WP9]|nr:hypothetical protein SAMN02787142_0623 [Burkholderia sp. WP9]
MRLDDPSFARLRLLAPMLDDVLRSHEIDSADQAAHLDELGALCLLLAQQYRDTHPA